MLQAQLTGLRRVRFAGSRALIWICALAVLLRLGAVFYVGNEVTELPGIYDQLSYQALAERVAAGHGFTFAEGHWPATRAGEPTAHWSFIYTLFLAGVYTLVGVHPLVARLIQAVAVGVLHTWLAYRVGKRVFGETAGLAAGLLSAIYLYFVYYAAGLLTEAFYFVGVLWTVDAALRLSSRTGTRSSAWVELGLAIGLTSLLRQVFLLFVPVLFFWLWWTLAATSSFSRAREIARGLAIAGLVLCALVLPWTARNYRAFGTFVPINTNAGFALFWGNHPIHDTSFIPLLPKAATTYGELIPPDLRALNEGRLDRELFRRAVLGITDDPVRFLHLSVSRTREYFKFWPSDDSTAVSNLGRVLSFGMFLPFMVTGLVLAITAAFRNTHLVSRAGVTLLLLWVCSYTAIHLVTWTLIRYRLPVDVVLLLFAGYAAARALGSKQLTSGGHQPRVTA